jgi:hypothetical protein
MLDDPMRELIARVNASAYLLPLSKEEKGSGRLPRKRQHRLVRRIDEALTLQQQRLLLALLKGERVLLTVRSEPYAAKRTAEGWSIVGLGPADREHFVVGGVCTCQDAKFRDRKCKHALALEGFDT